MNIVNLNRSPFDSIKHIDDRGNEIWFARELMPLLGYKRWDRVPSVVERAMLSCKNSGNSCDENFSEETRKSNGRPLQDFELTRYACYLVAMNGDPRKPEIALAQTYFSMKTYEAELIGSKPIESTHELEIKEVSEAIDLIFNNTNIKPELIAGVKINAIGKVKPELMGAIEEARPLLTESTASDEKLLTPTQIGKELGISAIKVNQLLIDAGLQTKNDRKSRKEPKYLPTDKGSQHSTFILATGRKENTTYQQLRWYPSIVPIIEKETNNSN